MEYKLLGVSGLILIILLLTCIKDGEKMDPPLKKRIVIDIVTIGIFWAVFEFYNYSNSKTYENEIALVVNGSLLFFFARMVQLIAQLNPMIQDLVKFLKKKGINLEDNK